MSDHRYINSKNDPALFKWPQGGLKLGQDSEVIPRNVHVLLFVDRSSIYSFVPCLIYISKWVISLLLSYIRKSSQILKRYKQGVSIPPYLDMVNFECSVYFFSVHYGIAGNGVSRPGIQNKTDFCIKINISKGNY